MEHSAAARRASHEDFAAVGSSPRGDPRWHGATSRLVRRLAVRLKTGSWNIFADKLAKVCRRSEENGLWVERVGEQIR